MASLNAFLERRSYSRALKNLRTPKWLAAFFKPEFASLALLHCALTKAYA
jgi:hypothetical protein